MRKGTMVLRGCEGCLTCGHQAEGVIGRASFGSHQPHKQGGPECCL